MKANEIKTIEDVREVLITQEVDHENFDNQLKKILENQKKTIDFMENMEGLSDFIKGTSLLKKPLMWFIAFIIGVVAMMGGLRTIISWFVIKN